MSTATSNFVFEGIARVAQQQTSDRFIANISDCERKPALRLALVDCEHLRFPHSEDWDVRILAGKAWITYAGKDFFLENGDSLCVPRVKHGAIISPMGKEALLFEIRSKIEN